VGRDRLVGVDIRIGADPLAQFIAGYLEVGALVECRDDVDADDAVVGVVFGVIIERGLSRSQHLPHDLARDIQLSADRLDRLALNKMRPPYPGNRLHYQHPKTGSPTTSVSTAC
jgi:hypothetical protein